MAMEKPSFFKPVSDDFTRKLQIPPVFCRKYPQIMREGYVTLRSSSGKTWKVKLEMNEDENYEFSHGWSRFAKDAGLKLGEFLVFWVVGTSMFHVAVYAATCTKREIPADNSTGDERRIHYSPPEVGASGSRQSMELPESENPLYFEVTLKKYHRSFLPVPGKFRDAAGLTHRGSMRLVYLPNNRCMSVVTNCRSGSRNEFYDGWSEFMKANKLVIGQRYSFEFKPTEGVVLVNTA